MEGGVGGSNVLLVPLYEKVWSSKNGAKALSRVSHMLKYPHPRVLGNFRSGIRERRYWSSAVERRTGARLRET